MCDRQIFNIGSPRNEISIAGMAAMMRAIYAEKFGGPAVRLPDIVSVTGEEFYGAGYDDSDRRIPDVTKARRLLGWEPKYGMRDALVKTMHYYVSAHRKQASSAVTSRA